MRLRIKPSPQTLRGPAISSFFPDCGAGWARAMRFNHDERGDRARHLLETTSLDIVERTARDFSPRAGGETRDLRTATTTMEPRA